MSQTDGRQIKSLVAPQKNCANKCLPNNISVGRNEIVCVVKNSSHYVSFAIALMLLIYVMATNCWTILPSTSYSINVTKSETETRQDPLQNITGNFLYRKKSSLKYSNFQPDIRRMSALRFRSLSEPRRTGRPAIHQFICGKKVDACLSQNKLCECNIRPGKKGTPISSPLQLYKIRNSRHIFHFDIYVAEIAAGL